MLAALCLTGTVAVAEETNRREFIVTFTKDVHPLPFTGRVYLFFSHNEDEPRQGPDWFDPEPFIARDVRDWSPDEPLTISTHDDTTLTFPRNFSHANLTGMRVQAIARFNPWEREVGTGAGNGFSDVGQVLADHSSPRLRIRHLVEPQTFVETERTKLIRVRSDKLSRFHERDVSLQAAVTLPTSYHQHPEQRYPIILIVPGFSGTHYDGRRRRANSGTGEQNEQGVEFIRVTLDPSCPLGHHAFADSANNGPWGTALIDEFLPALDQQFRTIADPRARFLTGHSSGGWSTLWLQVTYPESFGGVWSTAPDPVDFRDFQRINLYEPDGTMYVNTDGGRRPLARLRGQTALWYDDFVWMEHVLGPGGQLHSFEAVFSRRRDDGTPELLFDRESGVIDTAVARSWEPYDIRLKIEQNWQSLGPLLAGKLHVFMGSEDTFLLDGSTRLLKESLQRLDSDAVVELHDGKDHRTLMTTELMQRIRREMSTSFRGHFSNWPNL